MKVLFLTNSLEYGGIETNLVLLTEEFVGQGDEVHIAARPGPLTDVVADRGAVVHGLQVALRNPRAVLADRRRLKRIIKEVRPDIIHVFSASGAILLFGLRGPRPPVVTSIMGLGDHPFEANWKVQARNLVTVQGAERILLISPAIEEHVRRLPVREERLEPCDVVGIRLPHSHLSDNAHRKTVRQELGVQDHEKVIMTTGRLAVRKAHHLFIDAAARVHETHPDARFFIIGEGPKRQELEAKIQALGLDDVVTLLGEVDDVQRFHAAADLYVRPGVSEGFVGITVLEAQALGVPVVSYETKDVKLAITDNKTGRLVPNGDTGAMGETIIALLDHPDQAARLANAGKHAVEERFDITVVAERLRQTYGRTLETTGPQGPTSTPSHHTQESTS